MKANKVLSLAFVLALSCSVAFAQHGRGGGAPAGGSNAGNMGSTMSNGHDNGMGNAAGDRGGAMNSPRDTNSGASSMGKKSPDEILSNNTKLSSNLDKLLPNGMTAQQACSGFKNLGQCVAAIHVSHNLDIPFADLKAKVTSGDSLGKAIETLKPSANAKSETKKAKKQANQDMNSASS